MKILNADFIPTVTGHPRDMDFQEALDDTYDNAGLIHTSTISKKSLYLPGKSLRVPHICIRLEMNLDRRGESDCLLREFSF